MPVRACKPPRPEPAPIDLRIVTPPEDLPEVRDRALAILSRLLDQAREGRKDR